MENIYNTPQKRKCEIEHKTSASRSHRNRRSHTPSLKALENICETTITPSTDRRRSLRKISPTKRYIDDEFIVSPIKRSNRKRRTTCSYETNETITEELSDNSIEFCPCEPKVDIELFNDEIDVDGKNMYGFQTPKKRDALIKVVTNTPRTPKTPRYSKTTGTPKSSKTHSKLKTPESKRSRSLNIQPKSPSVIQNRVKKRISNRILDSSENDFSSDENDYLPTESKVSESSENNINKSNFSELDNDGEEFIRITQRRISISNLPKTPGTPKTSKTTLNPKTPESKLSRTSNIQPKTPSGIRSRVKKEISKKIQDSSEDDFSADETDYLPSESEESDSSENDNEKNNLSDLENDNDEEEVKKIARRRISVPILPKTPSSRKTVKKLTKEYIPESEEYFITHANKKIVTSDHTLDRLKNPRLAVDHLFTLLNSMKISSSHEKAIFNLLKDYQNTFSKWMVMLNEGFNIVCYGLGSKKKLLDSFHENMLSDRNVIVVNGFFPSLTIKDILDGIIVDILEISTSPANPHQAVDLIEEEYSKLPNYHIFLIVHNIDGTMLRNVKAQEILSRLAKIPNFHLVASIDHINAPLLWDNVKLSNYNFLWFDTTTLLPYTDETAFENSLLVQNSGELALSSIRSVFLSLTTNSRGIYMLIVKYQLKNSKKANYQGMSFKDLYYSCRESFLVSSDLALRAQLTEFLDHKLVRTKRSIDGTEFLQIPISANLLEQFVNEQEASVK